METEDELDMRLAGLFLVEMNHQLAFARLAARQINQALTAQPFDSDSFWYHVEAHIKSLVAILNILWTSNKTNPAKRRSRLLRELFELNDTNPPENLRATRNSFEHYDERIDSAWAQPGDYAFVDRNVMPLSMLTLEGQTLYARNYDPQNGELVAFDTTFNLVGAFSEMDAIMNTVNSIARSDSRLAPFIR